MEETGMDSFKGPDEIEIDLGDIFRKLVKRRRVLFSVVLLVVAGSVVYAFTAKPVYQAESRVMVDQSLPKYVKVDQTVITDTTDQTNFFNSQVEILKSRTLAQMVLQQLRTYEPLKKPEQRLDALLKQVKISPIRMTDLIDVSVEDHDPRVAAHIANLWTQAYIVFSSTDQLVQRRGELETDLYQNSKYLKEKNPVILGLENEIDAINEKIKNEYARLSMDRDDNAGVDGEQWQGDLSNVKIVDFATVPVKPAQPRKALILVMSLFLGLLAGCGLVFVLEALDQSIKTIQELEGAVKVSCLATIPLFKNKKASKDLVPEMVSQKVPMSLMAESFRHLRTSIIFSNPDYPKKTLMVTSSSASEGKSTSAVNLGIVFAQAGERTLLVDADMRCPRLHSIFKAQRSEGLTEILAYEKSDHRSFIQKTDIPNLDILTCGAIPPNPSELLGSKKMEEYIAKLASEYDRVILDSPPILAATDAVILSTKVNATILIVRSGFAHTQAVISSVKALKSVNSRILSIVLNMVDFYGQAPYGYSLYEPKTRQKMSVQKNTIFKKS